MTQIAPQPENLAQLVFWVRGEKVLLDADLAMLYGVETGALNRAVKRNIERFPADFMLQLTPEEWEDLKCQIGISSSPVAAAKVKKLGAIRSQVVTASAHGGRRAIPYAFTEQGVAMLSSVLHSQRAVEVNIAIMRTFVKLREIMATHKDLAIKIESLEAKYAGHDDEIQVIFKTIKKLLEPLPIPPKRRIGFKTNQGHSR